MDKMLSVKEIALELGLEDWQIRKLAREGNIPCYKIGRLFRFKLNEVLESIKYNKEVN